MRGRKGRPYLPAELRVDPRSCSPLEHQLMWAHADGAVALMAICIALGRPMHDWATPAALKRAAAMLRSAAAHVDRAALVSVAIPSLRSAAVSQVRPVQFAASR